MKRWMMCLAAFASLTLMAQVMMYRDVEWYEAKGPGKWNKVDGRLSIDRTGGALVFHKENNVRRAVGLQALEGIRYHTKGDSMLLLRVRGPQGQDEVLTFKLKGDKKDKEQVVTAVEAASSKQAERVDTEWKEK